MKLSKNSLFNCMLIFPKKRFGYRTDSSAFDLLSGHEYDSNFYF